MKTLDWYFNEKIDKKMTNIVDTVEDRIQNAILTAIDSIPAPKIEVAMRSKKASSGRDATSVMTNSERVEHIGLTAFSQNISEKNFTLYVVTTNDDTWKNIPVEVSELSVPGWHLTGNHILISWW